MLLCIIYLITKYIHVVHDSNFSGLPVLIMCAHNVAFQMYVHVQVSINGYFSMGERPQYSSLDNFSGSSSYSVVAPFAADMDTTGTGSVKYTQFTTSDSSQMSRVSTFIRFKTGNSFSGTRMMVAEWNGVPKYEGSVVSSVDL